MATAQMETWLTTFFQEDGAAANGTTAQLVQLVMETVGTSGGRDAIVPAELSSELRDNVGEFLEGEAPWEKLVGFCHFRKMIF